MKIIFATNNKHKLKEVQAVLGDGYRLVTPSELGITEEIPEDRPTIEGNASQKSHYLYERTGADCFADEHGPRGRGARRGAGSSLGTLCGTGTRFGAQHGASAAQYGRHNGPEGRFRTVISLILDGEEHLFEGIRRRRIATVPRGTNGFGYDPIFVPDGYAETFAEMSDEAKNAISHRGRAVVKLAAFLNSRP